MQSEFRRFIVKGTDTQLTELENLVREKGLSRDDLTLILRTLDLWDPNSDTLKQ